MSTAKEKKAARDSLTKRALFILVVLSLVVLMVYYVHSKSKPISSLVINLFTRFSSDRQTEIAVRPATPADYPYYLEIYPDLEIDQPPADEATWKESHLSSVTIITQGTRPVGYISIQSYGELYYLFYFVIGREHRQKGIGTKALKHVKNQAKQLGFNKWELDCDINHTIPYKMYIKAGMNKVGELYHLKAPYNSSLVRETNMNVIVVYDPQQWSSLEDKYGLRKGIAKLGAFSGSLPVLLVDSNGQARGVTIFSPSDFTLTSLVVDNSDDLLSFLVLLQGLRTVQAVPEWIYFWVNTGKKYSDIVLSSIPGAVVSEQFDYLVGSTSE